MTPTVTGNIGLAKIAAKRMYDRIGGRMEYGDLLSGACMGLMDAVRDYDPSRGAAFSTFAQTRIHGGIVDEMRRHDPNSRRYREKHKAETDAEDAFFVRHGRKPSEEELAELLGRPRMTEDCGLPAAGDNPDHAPFWWKADPKDGPETVTEKADWWKAAVKGFNRTDAAIILLYYRDGLSMKDIGKSLDMSESRVSQIHAILIQRLRASPRMKRMLEAETRDAA